MFQNEEQLEAIHGAVDRMIKRAIALDGTCTGEHGVGIGKRAYLYDELGEGTVELMKAVKKTIDPLNIMNPGKVRLRRARRHGGDTDNPVLMPQLYPDRPKQSKE